MNENNSLKINFFIKCDTTKLNLYCFEKTQCKERTILQE